MDHPNENGRPARKNRTRLCDAFNEHQQELLDLDLTQEPTGDIQRRFSEHLDDCPNCQEARIAAFEQRQRRRAEPPGLVPEDGWAISGVPVADLRDFDALLSQMVEASPQVSPAPDAVERAKSDAPRGAPAQRPDWMTRLVMWWVAQTDGLFAACAHLYRSTPRMAYVPAVAVVGLSLACGGHFWAENKDIERVWGTKQELSAEVDRLQKEVSQLVKANEQLRQEKSALVVQVQEQQGRMTRDAQVLSELLEQIRTYRNQMDETPHERTEFHGRLASSAKNGDSVVIEGSANLDLSPDGSWRRESNEGTVTLVQKGRPVESTVSPSSSDWAKRPFVHDRNGRVPNHGDEDKGMKP